ncbi:MAG: hypothetical protein KDA53_06455 [Hyphomonas sp.]|nr:hypothetical protein [Hyphomonas sp.]
MKTANYLLAPDGTAPDCAPAIQHSHGVHARAHTLARIEAALARMDAGRYGMCVACEQRIDLQRLEADPAEAVCSDCCETAEG